MSRDPLLIFSQPRCGSTSLMRLLCCHPLVDLITEPFNPHTSPFPEALPVRWGRTFDRLVASALDGHSGIKHVWHPTGWPVTKSLNHRLLRREWGTVIFLNRRNLLRQVVSNRIGLQSKVFHPEDRQGNKWEGLALGELGAHAIGRFLEDSPRHRRKMRRTLERSGNRFIDVWFEDLFDETLDLDARHGAIEGLMTRLGLSLDDTDVDRDCVARLLDPGPTRMNSEDTYRRVPGIDAIEARFGNDRTGWLFRPTRADPTEP